MPTDAHHPSRLLTDDMLARFEQRASVYDRENRFFDEDLAELRDSGYLRAPLPKSFGGPELALADVCALQQQLGAVAASTALAVNMHLAWVGLVADLHRDGDHSLDWTLERVADGDIFAFGQSDPGTDIPVLHSTCRAERVEGGWRFTGRKAFGTLSPVWDWMFVHAADHSDPARPQIVHGLLDRRSPGFHIEENWDTMAMRATQSHDTVLKGAVIGDEHIALVTPEGWAGEAPLIIKEFGWGLFGFAAVYTGIARRAYELTIEAMPRRSSVALGEGRSMAQHPEVQHYVAEMRMSLEAIESYLAHITREWSDGVDHGEDWPVKVVAAKCSITKAAFSIVDRALDLAGGAGIFNGGPLERLFRDCRVGRLHPANEMLTHEIVGKASLGVDFLDPVRWG